MKPARQVVKPTTHRSVGIVNASWFQPEGIVHESELEAAFVRHAILCPAVLSIQAQPFRLDWVDEDGNARQYVPDYLVTLSDRHRVVVEVRPVRFVGKDHAKFDATAATLASKEIGFVVVSDEHVSELRQRAGRLILRSARGELTEDKRSRASDLVRAAGTAGLAWEVALASGIFERDWHFLLGRRLVVADTGVELSLSSRLFLPLNWPGARDHERLQFEHWFGCQTWRPDVGV